MAVTCGKRNRAEVQGLFASAQDDKPNVAARIQYVSGQIPIMDHTKNFSYTGICSCQSFTIHVTTNAL